MFPEGHPVLLQPEAVEHIKEVKVLQAEVPVLTIVVEVLQVAIVLHTETAGLHQAVLLPLTVPVLIAAEALQAGQADLVVEAVGLHLQEVEVVAVLQAVEAEDKYS